MDRITMDADCRGHVGLVAGAGYPIPYEAIQPPPCTMAGAGRVRQNRTLLAHMRQAHALAKPSGRTASRKTNAKETGDAAG